MQAGFSGEIGKFFLFKAIQPTPIGADPQRPFGIGINIVNHIVGQPVFPGVAFECIVFQAV